MVQLAKLSAGVSIDAKDSVEEWKKKAGFNWTAQLAPVRYTTPDGEKEAKGRRVLYHSATGEPLSIVSDRYKPVQPADVAEFFRGFVNDLGIFRMERLGQFSGGRRLWGLAIADDPAHQIKLPGQDIMVRGLLLSTSYDLTSPTVVAQTSIRLFCTNQLRSVSMMAQRRQNQVARFTVRHSSIFSVAEQQRRVALDEEWAGFREIVETLAEKKVSRETAEVFFSELLYPEAEGNLTKGQLKKVDTLLGLREHAVGQDAASARDTGWGLVNAVTYYLDHASRAKSDDARTDRAWFGEGSRLKERAVELALSLN